MASPNPPLDLIITMGSTPQAFLFVPPSSGRVVSVDTLYHGIGLTLSTSQVITFNGASKDNAGDPPDGTTVSQGEDGKASTDAVDAIPGGPTAGRAPQHLSHGKDNTKLVDVIPGSNAASGSKRPYDTIADHADQPDHSHAQTEAGGSQAKKRDIAALKFKGTEHPPDVDEEVLVPIPKRLYEQLTETPIDFDDSATEPESSSDYKVNGRLKPKYLT